MLRSKGEKKRESDRASADVLGVWQRRVDHHVLAAACSLRVDRTCTGLTSAVGKSRFGAKFRHVAAIRFVGSDVALSGRINGTGEVALVLWRTRISANDGEGPRKGENVLHTG
jgi:hypothetical protein